MSKQFTDYCIYTIVHRAELAKAYNKGGPASFREGKNWATGHRLWTKAQNANLRMPILIGDATDCSKLIYWGILTRVEAGKQTTLYTVDYLRRVSGDHSPQELLLLSTRKHVAANFIRPYASCLTPEFIGERFTVAEYVKAFREIVVAPHHRRMLRFHYHAPNHELTATQMSKALDYPSYKVANLHYGKLGRLVGKQLGWKPLPEQAIFVLVTFEKPGHEWHWIMRPEVATAMEQIGWVEDEQAAIPEEVDVSAPLYEGAVRRIDVNSYERSCAAREMCILHYGCRCVACGQTLAEKYGETAQGLIHVHHLRQLADINAQYQVDPVQDLRPVCPSCHTVIHSRTPPYTVEEVTAMIEATRKNANHVITVASRKFAEARLAASGADLKTGRIRKGTASDLMAKLRNEG